MNRWRVTGGVAAVLLVIASCGGRADQTARRSSSVQKAAPAAPAPAQPKARPASPKRDEWHAPAKHAKADEKLPVPPAPQHALRGDNHALLTKSSGAPPAPSTQRGVVRAAHTPPVVVAGGKFHMDGEATATRAEVQQSTSTQVSTVSATSGIPHGSDALGGLGLIKTAGAAGLVINGSNVANVFHMWVSKLWSLDAATGQWYVSAKGIAIRDYSGNLMSPGGPCIQFKHTDQPADLTALWCNYLGEVQINGNGGSDSISISHSEEGDAFSYYADLYGGNGNDTLVSGDSAGVALFGDAGYDYMYGGPFSDYMLDADGGEMHGYGGQDHFNGGGNTTVDYYDSGFNGVRVVVGGGWVSGDGDAIDPCMGRVVGTVGNDDMTGDDCVNKFEGREGNDTLDGGRAGDMLDGGAGFNTISYLSIPEGVQVSLDNTMPQTQYDTLVSYGAVIGSRGNDVIYGTNGPDTIRGASGSDTIDGRGGDDTIFGDMAAGEGVTAPGADTVYGGDGADLLVGGDGADIMHGGTGADHIYGEAGNGNSLFGDDGDDYLQGSDVSTDQLDGGAGNDELWGGALDDTIWGGTENDYLQGGPGNDTLYGGAGDDELQGGSTGADTLFGEDGNDVLYGAAENDTLHGGNGNDALHGEDGDDNLYGEGGVDALAWGPGNDLLDAGAGDDTIDYTEAPGPVTISIDSINDDGVEGIGERDNVMPDPGSGLDEIIGSRFGDDLEGHNGRDWLVGGQGDDELSGEGGADVYEGDSGVDEARFDWASTPIYAHIGGVADSTGGTTIQSDIENVLGGTGNDTLIGTNADNELTGNVGNDTIYGNGGNDELFGYLNTNWGAPFDANDQGVFGRNLALPSFTDDDAIYGGAGADELDGGPGRDRLFGEADRDDLRGGSGQDYLVGADDATTNDNVNDEIDALDGYWAPGADSLSTTYHQNPFPDTIVCADNSLWNDEVKADAADVTTRCLHATRYDTSWTTAWNEGTDFPIFEIPNGFTMVDVIRDAAHNLLQIERNPEGGWDWMKFAQELGENDEAQMEWYEEAFEKEHVKVKRRADNRVEVSDLMFPLKPAADCVQGATRHTIVCNNVASINLSTGAGDDEVTLSGVNGSVNLGDGNDLVRADGAAVAIDGGNGTNTIVYSRASTATVNVSLDNVANDGEAGEGENVVHFQRIVGGAETDVFQGTSASETFDGGAGVNFVSYMDHTATQPVTATLPGVGATTNNNGWAAGGERDTLTNINGFYGGPEGDTVTGSPGNDVIRGGAGTDNLNGAGGTNTLGFGDKTLAQPVTVTLPETGTATVNVAADTAHGSGAETVTLQNFVNINGGAGADWFIGNSKANTFLGGDGNDRLDGRGGPDVLNGMNGNDIIDYTTKTAGVRVTVGDGANDGENNGAEGDDIVSSAGTDAIYGSNYNDTLIGDAGPQFFSAGAGDDTLEGEDGADTLYGGAGWDTVSYNTSIGMSLTVAWYSTGGPATGDYIGVDVEQINGGSGNDLFRGSLSQQKFDGGAGIDTVDYTDHSSAYPVTVTLPNIDTDPNAVSTGNGWAGATGGTPENDQLVHIENITGGSGNDTITGNSAANVLNGGAGNDKVNGGAGNDTLNGNDGSDQLHGNDGDDNFAWEAGADLYSGDNGIDMLNYAASTYAISVDQNKRVGVPCADGAIINGVSEADCVMATVENIIGSTTARSVIIGFTNDLDHKSGVNNFFWAPSNVGSYIDGGGGNDTIYGSNGNDILIGGPGNDSVFGGDGIDGLWGDSRGGTIDSRGVSVMPYGGYGNNTLDGGNGDDGLYGANGMLDTIKCGAGNDYVIYDFVIADTYTLKPTGDCETARANGF